MLEFIQLLAQRYQTVISHLNSHDPRLNQYQSCAKQLIFAEALVRKGLLIQSTPELPLQIAVIGPTQVGKSSLVNLLLQQEVAGVSPLAGFTRHSQGFCNQVSKQDNLALQGYFGRFQQLTVNELNAHRYDCYALTEGFNSRLLPPCVIWDTPDFDSIDSSDYQEGVIRTLALADIIILVVSKEKYADQSVWEMMTMLENFHQPTLICVNKLMTGTEALIIRSLAEKWQYARLNDPLPETVPLFYQSAKDSLVWSATKPLFQLAKKVSHRHYLNDQNQFLNRYWHTWLEPVVAEHKALSLWQALIDQCIEQALLAYQRDYLNHPHYYDTFQQALIELLNLLEIPGISRMMTKGRRILTWPVRKLISMGRSTPPPVSHEKTVLNQIAEHLFISLSEQLLLKIDSDTPLRSWWKDNYCLLRQQKESLMTCYQQAVNDYMTCFQQDIEATANQLYDKLSEQPVILNSLRATRVSTDAAAMALVIQTGGIGLHDLVMTPAMLSVTSLLAESAVGHYMGHIEAELKQHQLQTVKQDLLITHLQKTLYHLPGQQSKQNRFNISPEQLQQAERQRNPKKHGIRFF